VAEHAGYQRTIISQNPPLIDDEGYEIDSDDNEENVQEAVASAMESNPYASIHIERPSYPVLGALARLCELTLGLAELLGPLTSVIDLPSHPTLSRPYTSKALTELAKQSCSLMHKENKALAKVKPLLTKLVGDNTWVPCGAMIEPNDHELFTDTARFFQRVVDLSSPAPSAARSEKSTHNHVPGSARAESVPTILVTKTRSSGQSLPGRKEPGAAVDGHNAHKEPIPDESLGNARDTNGQEDGLAPSPPKPTPAQAQSGDDNSKVGDGEDGSAAKQTDTGNGDSHDVDMADETWDENQDQDGGGAPPPLQERDARAGPGGGPGGARGISSTPDALRLLEELFIHPLFLPPRAAHPDQNLGLPEAEAEDVRRLLQLYVQKQEEVCRGTKKLYEGLLKADRYRKTVWQWARAEAHCGPNRDMSDGEDWYDKEEWGLTEDLKKGEDEVEEETAQTQKKTRNRK